MDLISREAALDCFHDWIDRHGDVHTPDEMAEYRAIEELPFVESEKRTEELTETHVCDCISRREAIDICTSAIDLWNGQIGEGALMAVRDKIAELPSAQPERKKGEWIRNDNGTYSCSVCQSWIPEEQHYYARYCLYCGTDMRSENNERLNQQTGGD